MIQTFDLSHTPMLTPENIQISFQKLSEPDKKSRFFHPKFVLKIHLSGESQGYVENQLYTFQKGEAFLIFPFQFHCITNVKADSRKKTEEQIRLLINFDLPENEQRILVPLRGKTLRLDSEDMTLLLQLVQNIGNHQNQAQRECVFSMCSLLMRMLERVSADNAVSCVDKAPVGIAAAFQEMYANSWKNPSLKSIADTLGYSENGLRQHFFRETGQTPGRFMKALRMRKAIELLRHSQLSVKQISKECGFSDPYNFSRAFKNAFNCSPREYRNPYLKDAPATDQS